MSEEKVEYKLSRPQSKTSLFEDVLRKENQMEYVEPCVGCKYEDGDDRCDNCNEDDNGVADKFVPRDEVVPDMVNHPRHYTCGRYEVIDIIDDAVERLTGVEAFYTAQVLKYILRWKNKGGVEDLKKTRWYLDRMIQKMEAKG